MVEQWFSDYCEKCKSRNFINNGDLSDITGFDVQGIRCWNCGHCWRLDHLYEEFAEAEDDDPYYEDGVHFEEVKCKS